MQATEHLHHHDHTQDWVKTALLAGLAEAEIAALAGLMQPRSYAAGRRIIAAGEAATSLFFLQSGMVSVKLPSGVRLATLTAGMVVGEMALLEERRSADVWADMQVNCLELPLDAYIAWRDRHPHVGERIVRNRLPRQEIAKMIGASREMVSRVMKGLETDGFVVPLPEGRMPLREKIDSYVS